MQLQRVISLAELTVGAVMLAAGLALAAFAATNEAFSGVFVGMVLSVAGYKLSQYSATDTPVQDTTLGDLVADIRGAGSVLTLLMVIVGTATFAYGLTILFRSIPEARMGTAITATLTMIAGYIITHYAVNNTLV